MKQKGSVSGRGEIKESVHNFEQGTEVKVESAFRQFSNIKQLEPSPDPSDWRTSVGGQISEHSLVC